MSIKYDPLLRRLRTTDIESVASIGAQYKTFVTVGFEDADYICDGAEDNVQIKEAIDAVDSSGGGAVFIKSGTYITNGIIDLRPSNNITIVGEGRGTIIKSGGLLAGGSISKIFGQNSDASANITIKNLVLDGDNQSIMGIDFDSSTVGNTNILIEECEIKNNTSHGISLEKATNCVVKNNHVHDNGARGIYIFGSGSADNIVDGNLVEDNGTYGIQLQVVKRSVVVNNVVKNHIHERGIFMVKADHCIVSNNVTDGNNFSGIGLLGSDCVISNNTANNNLLDGILVNGTGDQGNAAVRNLISNNICNDNVRAGIQLQSYAYDNSVVGNYCKENGTNAINIQNYGRRNQIVGNYCYNNGDGTSDTGAIHITGSSPNNFVANNYITADSTTPMTKFGIRVGDSGSSGNILRDNYIRDIVSSNISDPAGVVVNFHNNLTVKADNLGEVTAGEGITIQGTTPRIKVNRLNPVSGSSINIASSELLLDRDLSLVNYRNGAVSSTGNSLIYGAADNFDGGSNAGSLVLQARSTLERHIHFVTGTTPTVRGSIRGNGDLRWRGKIQTDTIEEYTADAGVTIDGVTVKDGTVSSSPTISTGTATPATTPTKVGDTFIDTTNGNIYIAKGTASSADWVQVNN
jgi:parallel beta-helix repeat protein